MHKIVMEITLLIMETHGNIMELFFFNFCGNPERIKRLKELHALRGYFGPLRG